MYKLGQEEHDTIYSKIAKEELHNVPSQANPRVIITGGQPGSGLFRVSLNVYLEKRSKKTIETNKYSKPCSVSIH